MFDTIHMERETKHGELKLMKNVKQKCFFSLAIVGLYVAKTDLLHLPKK